MSSGAAAQNFFPFVPFQRGDPSTVELCHGAGEWVLPVEQGLRCLYHGIFGFWHW